MARKKSPQLTVLPRNPRQNKKVPKPQTTQIIGDPLSPRGAKARTNISIPGMKAR